MKQLWKACLTIVAVALLVLSFASTAIIARASSNKKEKERQAAVEAYMLTISTQAPVVVEPEPPEEEPRAYFDVSLSHDVQDHLFAECEKYGIDPAVVIAMIERESRFNTYALGDDGRSAGLMQIMTKWHLKRMIKLECTDLFDPCQNITVGIDILAEQLNRYGGDMAKALTAYNRGSYSGTVTNYAKEILKNAKEVHTND